MKELNFEQACEQVAKNKYKSWEECCDEVAKRYRVYFWFFFKEISYTPEFRDARLKEASELYASQYREELERLKKEYSDLQIAFKFERDEVERLMSEHNDLALENSDLKNALEEINNVLGETKALQNSYGDKIEKLNKQLQAAEERIKELEK